jgi:SAM-dependent methyltransferase
VESFASQSAGQATQSAGQDPAGLPGFGSASAESYDRLMGRYVPELARKLCDAAGIRPGQHVLDVGCGPGGLTGVLVSRVGAGQVTAIDPTPQFVAACRERNPGVDVREGVAEQLPWPDATFDAALASLVMAFMKDPDQGIREMKRVTRPGGTVATCMWDLAGGGMTMLQVWRSAVDAVRPDLQAGEPIPAGGTQGDIARRFRDAGLIDVTEGELTSHADYTDLDDLWLPFTMGVGPAARVVAAMSGAERAEVREQCRARLPQHAPFRLDARAWYATGTVPPAGGPM